MKGGQWIYPKYAVFGVVSSILVFHTKNDTVRLEKVARRATERAMEWLLYRKEKQNTLDRLSFFNLEKWQLKDLIKSQTAIH